MSASKRLFMIFFLLALAISMTACMAQKISDVKTPDMVDKTVRVSGIVQTTVKLGPISGYTLKDDSGTISVSSQALPKEGEHVTVKGVLKKDNTILGYYIKADE
jgi:hypothetical protein